MFDTKLRVRARTTPMPGMEAPPCVPDPHGSDMAVQRRRAIGYVHQEVAPGKWAWVATGKVEEHLYHHDLVKAVKDGELFAADEATAKTCGVKFDPTFGGEETTTKKPTGGGKTGEEQA